MGTKDGKASERSQAYLSALPAEIEALRRVAAAHRTDLLPFDLTYESIDRVEDLFGQVIGADPGREAVEATESRVTAYLGQTLIEHAGGSWSHGTARDEFPGRPCVTGLPHLGRFCFFPHVTTKAFRLYRSAGSLRDEAESYDVARLRERAARDLRDREREIEALRADVDKLLGRPTDLDFSLDSLAPLTSAIKRVSGRDAWRRLRPGASLYIGETARRMAGRGEWILCEDPANAYYGHLLLGEWNPTWTVYAASAPGGDDVLRASVVAAAELLAR